MTRFEAGTALLVALFLTVFAGFMRVPALQRAIFLHNNAFRENRSVTAFHMAEPGIEEAIRHPPLSSPCEAPP